MMPLLAAAVALAAVWACASAEAYALALHRSRMAVRRGARRARATLLAGVAMSAAVVAVAAVSVPRALAASPLLILPAVAVARWSFRPLGEIARVVTAAPWGPSDPPVRRTAADPALTVPPRAALIGSLAALPLMAGGWLAAVIAYGLAATATAALAWRAPRRRGAVERAGVLRRVLVRAKTPPDRIAGCEAA